MMEERGGERERRARWVPLEVLPMLRERVASLRRPAERLGLTAPELIEQGTRRDQHGGEHCLVELRGSLPRLDGWRVVAELHHDKTETRVEVVPGEELPAGEWQEASARCDHCGLRRRRRTTVLLRHRSGDLAQVGTACLADLTGERDPWASMVVRDAPERGPGQGVSLGEPPEPTLDDYLAAVAAEGASGDSSRRPRPTSPARRRPNGRRDGSRTGARSRRWTESAATRQSAGFCRSLRWRGTRAPTRRDWFRCSVGRSGWESATAMVASAWLAHERAHARAVQGEYMGEVGELVGLEASVREVRPTERGSCWGPVFWHALRDERGRDLSWFAVGRRLEEGARCRLRGRVRRHERFRGRAVTVLERCRVLGVEERESRSASVRQATSRPAREIRA